MYMLSITGGRIIAAKLELTEEKLLKLTYTRYHSNEFFYLISDLTEAFTKTNNSVLFATNYQFEFLKQSFRGITEI